MNFLKDTLKCTFKRIFFILLVFIFTFLIKGCTVNAAEILSYNLNYGQRYLTISVDYVSTYLAIPNMWKGETAGYLSLSALVYNGESGLSDVTVVANGSFINCNIGNQMGYLDNTNDFYLYNITCPVPSISTGVSGIYFVRSAEHSNTDEYVVLSSSITYVKDYQSSILSAIQSMNYYSILTDINNSINSSNSEIKNYLGTIDSRLNNGFNDIYNKLIQNNSQIIQSVQQTTTSVNNLNTTISSEQTDEDASSNTSSISSLGNSLNTNDAKFSDLFTFPIRFFQMILNNMNNCNTLNINGIEFPCISIKSFIGDTLYNLIDILITGMLCWNLRNRFVKIFLDLSSMKENGGDLD